MTARKVETNIRYAKGKLISGGVSGVIELLESGQVLKSPHVGRRAADSQEGLKIEARIYQHLGYHPRLIRLFNYSAKEGLSLEYMPNRNLKQYLRTHSKEITLDQRLQWACEVAEGLQFLHSRGVIHCDLRPSNLLLDSDLRLKVADFAGSSLDGSKPTIHGDRRFYVDCQETPNEHSDLFALGSTIFEIMTSSSPYEEIPDEEVSPLYLEKKFPSVARIICGQLIGRCWREEADSAEEVYVALRQRILDLQIAREF